MAESCELHVQNRDALVATPSAAKASDTIEVAWQVHSVPAHARNWIGVFRVDETNNRKYLTYQFVQCEKDAARSSFDLSKLNGLSVGDELELRFFERGSYNKNDIRSNRIKIVE